MINIINESIEHIYEQIIDKKLYIFGAGKRIKYLCDAYHFENSIEAIIDNNSELYGKELELNGRKIQIISVETFVNIVKRQKIENVILIISVSFLAGEVIEQLDAIKELNGLNCYLGRLIEDCIENQNIEFTKGNQLIPKKIHYCWVGQNPIPEHLQQYISSWKKFCPDYEIIRWDESNYDFKKNKYMKEAYECKKWGFVPDYARLDIVYNEGGIYLDTDVELISSLDKLLSDEMFCGFISEKMIGFGLGFGASPGNYLIRELRDIYDDYSFLDNEGKENLTSCSWYEHPILEAHGFEINGKYQKKDGVVIYPPEVLSPLGASMMVSKFTSNTVSIHHAELSWTTTREKEAFLKFSGRIKERLN